jgi:hypothetical protein
VGSTTVKVMAAASAASTALPPRAKAAAPACEAKGCEVAIMFRAKTGLRLTLSKEERSMIETKCIVTKEAIRISQRRAFDHPATDKQSPLMGFYQTLAAQKTSKTKDRRAIF